MEDRWDSSKEDEEQTDRAWPERTLTEKSSGMPSGHSQKSEKAGHPNETEFSLRRKERAPASQNHLGSWCSKKTAVTWSWQHLCVGHLFICK